MTSLIQFYVPDSHCEAVKAALFAVGAGRMEQYEHVCWQCEGQGQFRPLAGSHPFLGKHDVLKRVTEWKVEMICADELVEQAVAALLQHHPYETPAYAVIKMAHE